MDDYQYSRLSEVNRQAWDNLYGTTQDLVWGSEPVGFLKEFQADILNRVRPCSLALDAATGEGRNLPTVLDWGMRVVACDASSHAINKMPSALSRRVTRVISDLYVLPFRDSQFEFVLASDIIETLPNPELALRELSRVLRPGGLMLCNIPGMEDGIAEIEMDAIDDHRYLFRNQFFYQFLSESQANDLLTDNGFKVVKSGLCSWVENAHPEFRDAEHEHTSRIFLVERAA
jgi:SAM-dependent methyltransferase